jgi:hypothetical protein
MKSKINKKGFTKKMKTTYEIFEKKASSFGGLHPISELLETIKFNKLFADIFPNYRKVRQYKPVENLKILIAAILCGGDRLIDIERLQSDPVIPDLFGNGKVPQDTTVRNDLKYIGECPDERREFLFRLNEKLLRYSGFKKMTIDIDGTATPVEGHQTNALKGYCPESPGSRCFQHLLVSWDDMGSPLAIETRPGNTHCANGAVEMMKIALDRFSRQVELILVRDDAGFFSDKLLTLYESYPNVEYEVMSAKLEGLSAKITAACFKSYHGSGREYAVFPYAMVNGKERTYYVERVRCSDSAQLFEELGYKYRVIVSNRSGKQPHTLFNEYNCRARQEQLICESKNEFALGRIVSNDFFVTQAAAWVSMVACALIAIFRRVALRLDYHRYRMKRLRYYLFNIVAIFVKHAREKVLRIFSPPMGEWRYRKLIERIHAFY